MSAREIEFSIDGDEANEIARELIDLFAEEFEYSPRTIPVQQRQHSEKAKIDPVAIAIAALILAVPSAILAAKDLADRITKKQKVDKLINWAKKLYEKDPASVISITFPDGSVLQLHKTTSGKILDAAESTEK